MRLLIFLLSIFLLFEIWTTAYADQSNLPLKVTAKDPCKSTQLPRFRTFVFSRAKNPKQLWGIVSSVLCDTQKPLSRTTTIYAHLTKTVRHTQEHIDSEPTTEMAGRSEELVIDMILATTVNYAELSFFNDRQAIIEYSGDICSRRIKANYRKGKWLIGEYTSSCD